MVSKVRSLFLNFGVYENLKYSKDEVFSSKTTRITVALVIVSIVTVLDVLAIRILVFMGPNYSIIGSVYGFIITFITSQIVTALILKAILSYKSIITYGSKSFRVFYIAVILSPLISSLLVVLIIYQLLIEESYNVVLIPLTSAVSVLPTIVVLSFLVYKFVKWLRNKNDRLLLSYTIAISTILINIIFLLLNLPSHFYNFDLEREATTVHRRISDVGVPNQSFKTLYQYSSYFSFIGTWIATSILLRNYSRKVGELIYWLIVSIPMLYFLGQNPLVFSTLFSMIRDTDPSLYVLLYSLFFGVTKATGGTFFAIAFWTMGRAIKNKKIGNYLKLSGFGILLLFVSSQANSIIISPYPPFGIIAITSITLAALLTFVGLYFTALSVSREASLRAEIGKKVSKLSFVRKMGTAQLEEDVYKQVLPVLEKSFEDDNNIPTSLGDEDIKLFVKEALRALKKKEDDAI